jgi:hypothetical protein
MELTVKDIEKLKKIKDSINRGIATTYDKSACIESINSILEPKCTVCRGIIESDLIVINDRKMHEKCRSKYRG